MFTFIHLYLLVSFNDDYLKKKAQQFLNYFKDFSSKLFHAAMTLLQIPI